MFLSTYTPKLDERERLILPARFREALKGELVVTCAQERALTVYPRDTFEMLMTPVSAAPSTLKQARDYRHILTTGVSFEVPDRQGRITIPPTLRSYAGLERDVVMIDAMNRAEIWGAEYWVEYQAERESGFTEFGTEPLSQLGQ